MSGSNRGKGTAPLSPIGLIAIAIIGAWFLAYSLGVLNGHQAERRDKTPTTYRQAAKADAQGSCVGGDNSAVFECVYEKVEASQETAYAKQDLTAQQRAADSALTSALIALLTLIATSIGVWFVKRTLDATLEAVKDTGEATNEMRRSNDIASKSAYLQLRAYISVISVSIHTYKRKPDKCIWVDHTIVIRNTGGTPGILRDKTNASSMHSMEPMDFPSGGFQSMGDGQLVINPNSEIRMNVRTGYNFRAEPHKVSAGIDFYLLYSDHEGNEHVESSKWGTDVKNLSDLMASPKLELRCISRRAKPHESLVLMRDQEKQP